MVPILILFLLQDQADHTPFQTFDKYFSRLIKAYNRKEAALAKKEGRYKGRNKIVVPGIEEYYNRYMTRQATKTQIAKELKISRCTLDRLFREYKISQ